MGRARPRVWAQWTRSWCVRPVCGYNSMSAVPSAYSFTNSYSVCASFPCLKSTFWRGLSS